MLILLNNSRISPCRPHIARYPRIKLSPGSDAKQAVFEGGYLAQSSAYFRKAKYDALGGINKALHLCMQIRQPTAAGPIVTGLRYIESNLDAMLLHPGLSAVPEFVSHRIAHQATQRLYQIPFKAAIPSYGGDDGFLEKSTSEPELRLARQPSIMDRRVGII